MAGVPPDTRERGPVPKNDDQSVAINRLTFPTKIQNYSLMKDGGYIERRLMFGIFGTVVENYPSNGEIFIEI